ncbi:hypothetical protein SmJEL517_g05008 [Synchytrium microbalum]|uniref:Coronin n=1 Tax=Synchytrium microbalum TaxID=1806994 RepID=A0A507BRG0_9FUNG|nr:uncharacterized protein SmJEL517_g05008 [Synchytrium microbalum]TPX31727.1 hypothetical protein SmJEL517_g05008 [Synchytrium microbalum]
MAWRAAVSKYRNSTVTPASKENWYQFQTSSVFTSTDYVPICSSKTLIATKLQAGGGSSVAIIPLSSTGRLASTPTLSLSSVVIDLDFSPFNHGLLAVGHDDGSVRVFQLPPEGISDNTSSSTTSLPPSQKRVDVVRFHPTASDVLSSASNSEISLWNLESTTKRITFDNDGALVNSLSWKDDGSLFVTTAKDNIVRVYDPRAGAKIVASCKIHDGVKPGRAVWLGSSDQIASTGFSRFRDREYGLYDIRKPEKAATVVKMDQGTGPLIPLYDVDTSILVIVGKGDTRINWMETKDSDPWLMPPGQPTILPTPYAAATLIPKYSLDVLQCEVARLLLATSDGLSIVPVSFKVPRRSYIDFAGDIFPLTKSDIPALSSTQWFAGENKECTKISLDPRNAVSATATSQPYKSQQSVSTSSTSSAPPTVTTLFSKQMPSDTVASPISSSPVVTSPVISSPLALNPDLASRMTRSGSESSINSTSSGRKGFIAMKTSSYRFLTGKSALKFEDLKGLATNVPFEAEMIDANEDFICFPMAGNGGRLAVIDATKPCRLPNRLPCFVGGSDLTSFSFDPFDSSRIVTGCDDGKVRIWKVPSGGLQGEDDEATPQSRFSAHENRVVHLVFHPAAKDVILTSSPERGTPAVKIWNLVTESVISSLAHPDQILACCWSWDGTQIATCCRDKKIRIFDARSGKQLQEGPSHDGIKGARIVFLGDSGRLVSLGFGRGSQREINIYSTSSLSSPLSTTVVDTSPSLFAVLYNEPVLYLVGRGETYVTMFEVGDSCTFLTRYDAPGISQGVAYLPPRTVDVKAVEMVKGFRLTQTGVESISFTVPRLKKEYFQDDLYPPIRDTTTPLLSAEQWASGQNYEWKFVSLAPSDMTPLSQAPPDAVKPGQIKAKNMVREMTAAEQKAASMKAMWEQAQLEAKDDVLPQDKAQGVADDEWD